MSTIFFCQEQGSGLGHTMQMLPLARGLVEHGHRVFVALRDADGAEAVFAGSGVCYLDAPRRNETSPRARRPTFPVTGSFAHVLANVGWDNTRTLFTLGNMWQNLFAGFRPDGLVCDHSPSALLAARGLPKRVPRILLGSGFCCPPDSFPLGVFPGKRDAEQLAED